MAADDDRTGDGRVSRRRGAAVAAAVTGRPVGGVAGVPVGGVAGVPVGDVAGVPVGPTAADQPELAGAAGFTVLDAATCWGRLATEDVGRVVYTDHAMPAITPVHYALDGRSVVFRTDPGSRFGRMARGSVVAFEADVVERTTHSGWSVVVTGIADVIYSAGALRRAELLGLAPWVPGDRGLFIRITPGLVTGREVVAGGIA